MAKRLKDVRDKLELSKLDSQKELLSDDLDLSELSLVAKGLPNYRFEEAIISADINRTIEGASTVNLGVNDRYGILRNSGRLGSKVDIKIDGLWFRLVNVSKQGHDLDLSFESREVAVLRTYDKFRASKWGQLTRSRFAQILVNEVKEFHIPFVCPELHRTHFDKNQAEKHKNRSSGFGDWKTALSRAETMNKPVTIKLSPPRSEQLRNAELILDEGVHMVVRRKLLVCAIMTAIQESTLYNHPFGDRDSVGLFQQRASWGSFADRMNPTKAAHKFYEHAQRVDAAHPDYDYAELCQAVQISAFPRAYAQWRIEAERLVTAYGVAGGDTSTDRDTADANNMQRTLELQRGTANFQFFRGRPKTRTEKAERENSWDCLQRLADEVGWRCFEVSGSIYFISEPRLFRSQPVTHISEESEGVDWIDYNYDVGKKNAQLTITARLDRWGAPPGSTISIQDSGPINGRWLVSDIGRSLFDAKAQITCKKPRAKLPEPKRKDITGLLDLPKKKQREFDPTPGYDVRPPGQYPHGKELRDAVINNQKITFTRGSQTQDIAMGLIKPNLLRFMLAFTDAGFSITVTALKSDHSKFTNSGNISNHWRGLAVDMGNYQGQGPGVRLAQTWIRDHHIQLRVDEEIGPIDSLVYPAAGYDNSTLADHEDHIHVAVFQ